MSGLQITPVVGAFESLGLDSARILSRAGISPERLARGERLSAESELAFWQTAVELSADGALGLRVAERLKPGALGSFEYLLRHSETLGQLLLRAQRYGRVVDDLSHVTWRVRDGLVTIRVGRRGDYPVPPAGIECLFSVTLSIARRAWPNLRPEAVHFSHACSGDPALYRAHFGEVVRFRAAGNEIVSAERWLYEPAATADRALGQVLEEHTAYLLSQLPRSQRFHEVARERMRSLLECGSLDPERLARALFVSERTLRRRLAAEGSSYLALLDQVRCNLALGRVAHDAISFPELAEALGYADTSTFYRAFKRWTGTTPAKYRERHRHGP